MADVTHPRTPTPRPRRTGGPDDLDPPRRLRNLWRQGQRPRVEDFVEQAGINDPEQIVMLVQVDQAERHRLGEWVAAEEYLDAFPAVRGHAESAIDLIFAEYLLREDRGEQPAAEEFLRRFPEHARELKLQLELHRAIEHDRANGRLTTEATLAEEGGPASQDEPIVRPVIPGYEILGVLGRGGMGIVYRAWQAELNRPVAVKMLLAGALAGADALARLRVEVEAMARLRHPNIVRIHGVGHHAGAPFLVLELVEGRSLAESLDGTPQPADAAARMMEALALAIHAAHRLGVVHRDLTPSNILIADDGTPRITDFGLARLIGGGAARTLTGDLLGTPSYMAPEQAAGTSRAIGEATDVYALGAILYEMLTGRPPFKAEQPTETLRQVVDDEPIAPSRLRPRLPTDLETICLKCLHKEPARRYASAEALADELHRFLDRRPILSRRSGPVERLARWCRRNPGVASASLLAAGLLVFVAIGSGLAAWKFGRDAQRIRSAELATRESLFEALTAQAQARRFSHRAGQRFESLDALGRAVSIARELGLPPGRLDVLRDESIACMALPDLRQSGRVIPRPTGVALVTFDPAMRRYALRFRDGTIQVCRVADDAEIDRYRARGERDVFVFRFSPDGRYLATTHFPGFTLTVRDVDRRAVVIDAPESVAYSAARFSPDSRRIALESANGSTILYELATGRRMAAWAGPPTGRDLAYRADGTQIATLHNGADGSTCRLVEAEAGRLLVAIPLPSPGESVAWSADGTTLATACRSAKIYLWDAATGRGNAVLDGATMGGVHADFHPTGALLVSNGWDDRLRLWDPIMGQAILRMSAGGGGSLADFSQDGRIVVANESTLTIHEVDPAIEYRSLARPLDSPSALGRVSISGDGRVLAVCTSRDVTLWDLARNVELGSLPIPGAKYALFQASGELVTLSRGPAEIHRWPVRLDPDRGELRIGPPRRVPFPFGSGIALDRSGRTLAVTYRKSIVELETSVVVQTPGHTIPVGKLNDCRSVALSPDGRWLATGTHNGAAQVWRLGVDQADKVAELPVEFGRELSFSPLGSSLMTQAPPCSLWEPATGREVRRIGGFGLGFSPDGRWLATQDARKVILLVDTETGRTVARLESPDLCAVEASAFSPDGSRLVVTTNDGPAVHVWDLRAIRRRLVDMGLDWDAPPYPDADPLPPPPLRLVVDSREAIDARPPDRGDERRATGNREVAADRFQDPHGALLTPATDGRIIGP